MLVGVLVGVLIGVLTLLLVLMLVLMILLLVLVELVESLWRWCWCYCRCHCCYRCGSSSARVCFFFSRRRGFHKERCSPPVARKKKLAKITGNLPPAVPRAVFCCVAFGRSEGDEGVASFDGQKSRRLLSHSG